MDLGLHGLVALVTGGSKGIGKASALGLAREGADVAICARGQDLLERVAAEIAQQTGRSILPIAADLNREEDAQRANMVTFLASERASFVTGAAISLDGAQRKAVMDV